MFYLQKWCSFDALRRKRRHTTSISTLPLRRLDIRSFRCWMSTPVLTNSFRRSSPFGRRWLPSWLRWSTCWPRIRRSCSRRCVRRRLTPRRRSTQALHVPMTTSFIITNDNVAALRKFFGSHSAALHTIRYLAIKSVVRGFGNIHIPVTYCGFPLTWTRIISLSGATKPARTDTVWWAGCSSSHLWTRSLSAFQLLCSIIFHMQWFRSSLGDLGLISE